MEKLIVKNVFLLLLYVSLSRNLEATCVPLTAFSQVVGS